MKSIIEILYEREQRNKIECEKCKKKYNSMSLVERNAYEEILDRNDSDLMSLSMLYAVPKAIVYLFLFGAALYFLVDVNVFNSFGEVAIILLKYWIFFILIGVLADMLSIIHRTKLSRKLLLNKK